MKLKTLKIDSKWSVLYDEEDNDRPVTVNRYDEPQSNWEENNMVLAMFYRLLEADQKLRAMSTILREER